MRMYLSALFLTYEIFYTIFRILANRAFVLWLNIKFTFILNDVNRKNYLAVATSDEKCDYVNKRTDRQKVFTENITVSHKRGKIENSAYILHGAQHSQFS